MFNPILVYGASGFTGRLLVEALLARGIQPIVGGRDEAKLRSLFGGLGLEIRVAVVDRPEELVAALDGVSVAVNSAGPFSRTAVPWLEACFATGAHYVDVTGEIPVIAALAERDAEARRRRVMVMPAAGFDVVPTDCLCAHVARRMPGAISLELGLTTLEFVTRGSAETLVETIGYGVTRRDGRLVATAAGSLERDFDFGDGLRRCVNASWGDVATAWYTTGIPNVTVYFETTPRLRLMLLGNSLAPILRLAPMQAWMKGWMKALPEGPTSQERAGVRMRIVAEARRQSGERATARLHTPEAYSFTGTVAAGVVARALAGDVEPGFQTAARIYGPDFVLEFDGVEREDLD